MTQKCSENKIAVLLFTRTARNEAREKNFIKSGDTRSNVGVADLLLDQAKQTAEESNLPTIITYDFEQRGVSFNERFANAIEDVFALGYEKVISIGSDTPQLSKKHIDLTLQKLETNDLVLGPSADGGVYLIGFSAQSFHKDRFLKLPWLTDALYNDLVDYALDHGNRIGTLEKLTDVDNAEDLLGILHQLVENSTLYHLLLHLLFNDPQQSISALTEDIRKTGGITPALRGPPAYFVS